jgi:hypothetical protein
VTGPLQVVWLSGSASGYWCANAKLENSATFAGTVAGMTGHDTIDFADIDLTKAQAASYSGDISGGTLSWSGCRVGLAPTGKRRLFTAHAISRLMQCSEKAQGRVVTTGSDQIRAYGRESRLGRRLCRFTDDDERRPVFRFDQIGLLRMIDHCQHGLPQRFAVR